jgi:SAM-dependent methyltransferase
VEARADPEKSRWRLLDAIGRASQNLDADSLHISLRRAAFCLAIASFLGLYFELIAIRWLSSEIRYFAYYKNVPLMACFLGLGIGFSRADRPSNPLPIFLPLFSFLALLLMFGSRTILSEIHAPPTDEIFIGAHTTSLLGTISFYALIGGGYLAIAGCFIPMGQGIGRWMARFNPLAGYTINVGASLLGVLTITLLSFLSTTPLTWYLIGGGGCLLVIGLVRPRLAIPSALAMILLVAATAALPKGEWQKVFWSPYSKLELYPLVEPGKQPHSSVQLGSVIRANQDYYQRAVDFSEFSVRSFPNLRRWQQAYELPYSFRPPGDVLILGAGMGNDVAAALRRDAQEVVAVEIDPLIHKLGAEVHPERPYSDPRVTVVTDDARAFLRKTDKRFDTVAYGLLDSHGVFSSMSAVRVDNFVYTVEGIREAGNRLNPGGILSVTFAVPPGADWIQHRLVSIVREALGQEPLCFSPRYDLGFTVVSGPGLAEIDLGRMELSPVPCDGENLDVDPLDTSVPTDDWPFLYLPRKEVPQLYLRVLGLIAVASLLLILVTHPGMRRIEWHFFFLGAGFMLIETKAITDLALVVGTTWIVNSFAFASILAMILVGNGLVYRFPNIGLRIPYVLLFAAIALDYFLPSDALLGLGFLSRGLLTAALIALPIAFSAIIFARSVSTAGTLASVLGSNLLGAMVGGSFEYASVIFGVQMLWVVALAFYGLSALCLVRLR